MGITPITRLTPLPVARPLQANLDPLPMARVENSARSGDETYSPSDGESAGGTDENSPQDDGIEEALFESQLAGDESEDERPDLANDGDAEVFGPPHDDGQPRPVSYFA
jgi:hypothetical protein